MGIDREFIKNLNNRIQVLTFFLKDKELHDIIKVEYRV